jgi:hypothetical protein
LFWENSPLQQGLATFKLPLGDLADIQAGDAEDIIRGKGIEALSERYGTEFIVVAELKKTFFETPNDLNERPDQDRIATESSHQLGLTWYIDGAYQKDETWSLTGDQQDVFLAAYAKIAESTERFWKSQVSASGGPEQSITLRVVAQSLRDVQDIRSTLERTPNISSIDTIGLSAGQAVWSLSFRGGPVDLAKKLEEDGLVLFQSKQADPAGRVDYLLRKE